MPRRKTKIRTGPKVAVSDTDLETRCFTCKKRPKNCVCFEFRIEVSDGVGMVFVDNVACEPVRGDVVGTWRARRNANLYLRPTYLDGFGPILYTRDAETIKTIKKSIAHKTFKIDNWKEQEGCRVYTFEKSLQRRHVFLRKPRKPRGVPASAYGFVSAT